MLTLLLACAAPNPTDTSDTSTPTDTWDTSDTYAPEIVWDDQACGAVVDCGTLTLPVDHADPHGPTFELAVARYPAKSGDPKGALFYNFGGPGAPMVDTIKYGANQAFPELSQDYDIVTFDPRGVGGSTPFSCGTDMAALVDGAPIPSDLDRVAELQALQRAYQDPCVQEHPDMAAHMGLQHWADDMDAVRSALGFDTILYYGVSAASSLGVQYAERHPEHVERMLLDSILPAQGGMSQLQVYQNQGLDEVFALWGAWCAATPGSCAVSDDPMGAVDSLWADLQDGPVQVGEREVGWITIGYGLTNALYNDAGWSALGAALDDARHGDHAAAAAAGDAYFSRQRDGTYDTFLPTFNLTLCANELRRPDAAGVLELMDGDYQVPFVAPLDAFSQSFCTVLDPSDDPLQERATAAGVGPIVLLQSIDDFATPMEAADDVHNALQDSILVTRDSSDHAAYFTSACMHDIGVAFLVDGVEPEGGLSCFD